MKSMAGVPKYVILAEEYRENIRSGKLQPGNRLPTFQEMRRLHGVSQSILERVHGILQKEGLIEKRERSGIYVTDAQARPRQASAIALVGLQSWHANTAYTHQLIEGIQSTLLADGVNLMVINNDSTEPAAWEKIDGMLVCESKPAHFRQLVRRRPPGMPCVSVLARADEMTEVKSVTVDDTAALREATNYLLAQGHRRIAYLSGRGDLITRRRRQGYLATMQAAGITPEESWMRRLYVPQNPAERPAMDVYARAERTMRRWLQSDWRENRCTALLAQNDETARAAIDVLGEYGLQVPGDVSVIGFDGLEPASHLTPLTTLEVPLREVGRQGARLLLDEIADKNPESDSIQLPALLRIGATTAPPQTGGL